MEKMNENDNVPLTVCPFCQMDGETGLLKKGKNREWLCTNCGHVFSDLNAYLRAGNMALSEKRLSEAEKNRANGKKNIHVWKAIKPKKELINQIVFEFAEIRCHHCGHERTKKNAKTFIHRFNRAVSWIQIDGRFFCPVCFAARHYEKYS